MIYKVTEIAIITLSLGWYPKLQRVDPGFSKGGGGEGTTNAKGASFVGGFLAF